MEVILISMKWQYALVYLDDMAIFSKTLEKRIYHVKQKLALSKPAGIIFILKQCYLFTATIKELEYLTRPRRLEIAPQSDGVNQNFKQPRNIMKLYSFILS